jgi:hypothetical protein
MKSNTVFGVPERQFCANWITMLWFAMSKTGKGYRRPSLRNSGKGTNRRVDKLGTYMSTKLERRLMKKAIQA